MNSQGASLNESLLTGLVVTGIWPFIRVYAVMPLEVGFAIEALSLARHVSLMQELAIGCLHSPSGILHAIGTEMDGLVVTECLSGLLRSQL